MQIPYRIYPIIGLSLIAAATFWLERSTRAPETLPKDPFSRAPDFIAENTITKRFDKTGNLQAHMTAEKITHVPREKRFDMQAPVLHFTQPGQVIHVQSKTGVAWELQEQIDLAGDVQVVRERPRLPVSTLNSETLQVWPKDQKIQTNSPVVLAEGKQRIQAQSMKADNLLGKVSFHGKVRVDYTPRSGKSK